MLPCYHEARLGSMREGRLDAAGGCTFTGMRTAMLLLAAGLLATRVAAAMPAVGEPLPYTEGKNLHEEVVGTDEFVGSRTLLVVLTDRHGSEEVEAWFARAEKVLPPEVALKSIVSLRLPFFVGQGMAIDRAREDTPPDAWDDTLLDVRGQMAEDLGLQSSRVPYVFALDENGEVIAGVHTTVDDPASEEIWQSLTP